MKDHALTIVVLATMMAAPAAHAVDLNLPPVNLGATSFEDGAGGVGRMFQLSVSRFDAERSYDADGNRRHVDYDRNVWVERLHLAYTSPTQVLGGNAGADVIVPFMQMDLRVGPSDASTSGLGNPLAGVYVQWRDKSLWALPFASRAAIAFLLPIGQYDASDKLNPGTDYLSFVPYYAFTVRPSDAWEVSGRLMYLWNGSSDDPEARVLRQAGAQVEDVQPGQAFHYNLSASYAVTPQWRLGLGLYHLVQTSADRIDGKSQADSKERIFGIGPGVQWRQGRGRFVGNLYVEDHARNRSAGTQLVLRYLHVF